MVIFYEIIVILILGVLDFWLGRKIKTAKTEIDRQMADGAEIWLRKSLSNDKRR